MRVGVFALALWTLLPSTARPYETVTALDDAFSIPSTVTPEEGVMHFPGSESLLRGAFVTVARSVPFGVEELAVSTVAAGARFGAAGVSFSYSGSGFDLFGDEREMAGCSLSLGGGLSAGARLTRTAVRMKGFGDGEAWNTDLGAVWCPAGSVCLGGSLENAAKTGLGDSHEPLERRGQVSLAWAQSDTATLFASMAKEGRFDPSASAGCTMEVSHILRLGAAAGSGPQRFEFLAAITGYRVRFSYRGSFHRDLGFSHGFSVMWGAQPDR
jgi:hypothetical protein